MSILITSPSLMKIGTLTSAPVSTVAGLVTLVAVLPLTPGSVLKLDEYRGFDREDAALIGNEAANHAFLDELEAVGKLTCVERDLVVGLLIHEIIKIAVVIAVFHVFSFDDRYREACGGVERSFDDSAGDHVAHFGPDKSRALAGFDVLELDDLHKSSVVFKGQAVSEFACRYHMISS